MVDAVIGEIRPFAGNYAPDGWLPCDGRTVSISTYEALYSLVGTIWGGNGVTNFCLPDLRGRLPVCQGLGAGLTQRTLGQHAGSVTVQLNTPQMPQHTHAFSVSKNDGSSNVVAANAVLAHPAQLPGGAISAYVAPGTSGITAQTFSPNTVTTASGGSQPHDNLMPYQAVNFIIAVFGIFPTRP